MASYPYYSPPPPPSPPCNNTTSPTLLPPPPPACNHTATPTLSPPQPPPPPAQSPYSYPPHSLSPPSPTPPLPQKPPQWGPPRSSNCTQPKSPQPPTSPSPPPPSSYPYHSPPPPSSPCNTTTPTLQPLPPPAPGCGCNKTTPTLPSPPPPPPSSHYSPPLVSLSPPPSSRSQPPPSPSHPSSPPPPTFYHSPPIHSPPAPPPPRSLPSPPPLLPPPSLPSPSPPPLPSSFSPPLHSPPPPPRSPPPPPLYYSPPPLPPPSSPRPPIPSTPLPSPLSPTSPNDISISPAPSPAPEPAPPLPGTAVLATFAALGCLFLISGLLSMAQKKGKLPSQLSRLLQLLRGNNIPSGSQAGKGSDDLERQGLQTSNDSSRITKKMSSDLSHEESVNKFSDAPEAESNEVGEESKDSEKKRRLRKTKKRSSRAKKSGDKQSGMRQGLTTGCCQVLNIGCCLDLNNEAEGEGSRSGAHKEESDDRLGKSRINQSESDNGEAAQYGEKEPDEGGEKSYESGQKSLQTKNHPGSRRRGKQKLSEISTALDGGLNLEDLEYPSNVNDEISHEHHSNPICNQSENDGKDVTQDVKQQSDAVKRRLTSSKETSCLHKKKHSSLLVGNQNSSIVGQVSNAASNVDLDEEVQSQDNAQDEEEVHESEPQKDYKELGVGGPKNDPRGRQALTRARSREEPLNLNQRMSTGSGNDSSSVVVSLDDEEGKVEELNSFASARRGAQGMQALSKATAPNFVQFLATINMDDSSEELKSLGGDDYKDDKEKVHELKSSCSNKDSRGRQHRTQGREEVKLFNIQKIGTAVTGSDPGKAPVSFDGEDDKVQESEPIASNGGSYFQQPLSSAQGTDQSPNLVQNLTATINDDPNVELKSLGDRGYKGRRAEVYELSKDSRRTKGNIMGSGTRIEPPNLDQIVTARMGDDLGKGLESLGGNQFGKSYKDGSNKDVPGSGQTSRGTQQLPNLVQILTATNEGDPNPELEFCEDDKELELEYSMRDLSLQEPAPGEIEPSIDDQSVFATVDDDPDVLQFHNNEHDEELAESNKDARPGKPLSRPRTTSLRGKRRA